MRVRINAKMSESMAFVVCLTLAGGLQDAYSYNCRGKVFVNGQTGNIVLLGQNLAEGNWIRALDYLVPLLAFITGIYLAVRIQHRCQEFKKIHWKQIILMIQILLLTAVGFMPESLNMTANAVMSFTCAMQVNAFREFRGLSYATTMCIGNMRSATEMLCKYHVTGDKTLKRKSQYYYFIVFIFAVGAAIGAVLSRYMGNHTIWITAGLLAVGFILMFIKSDIQKECC